MSFPPSFRVIFVRCVPALLVGAFAVPATSQALQPLPEFIQSARTFSPDNDEAIAGQHAQEAQADVDLGRALPGASARGVYTRNQYQIPFGPAPPLLSKKVYIERNDQFDGFFTINIPLLDLASFTRISAARMAADGAAAQTKATALQVEATVTQDYFRLVANQALVAAAKKSVAVAKANLQRTQTQVDSGRAAGLDLDRARADVERQTQILTGAQLGATSAAIALASASGIKPDLSAEIALTDDLHEEGTLESFQSHGSDLPGLAAAQLARASAEEQALSQKLAIIPSLSGTLAEHGTNATSFIGYPWTYSATVAINWQFDYTNIALIRAQNAGAAAARAREKRVQLLVGDAIQQTWAAVGEAIARSRSARAQQQATTHASQLAQDRYEAGGTTQLELLEAQRDAFGADAARIQADADLANARIQLRIAAGLDPFSTKGNP